jgi:hypothetical protein
LFLIDASEVTHILKLRQWQHERLSQLIGGETMDDGTKSILKQFGKMSLHKHPWPFWSFHASLAIIPPLMVLLHVTLLTVTLRGNLGKE